MTFHLDAPSLRSAFARSVGDPQLAVKPASGRVDDRTSGVVIPPSWAGPEAGRPLPPDVDALHGS